VGFEGSCDCGHLRCLQPATIGGLASLNRAGGYDWRVMAITGVQAPRRTTNTVEARRVEVLQLRVRGCTPLSSRNSCWVVFVCNSSWSCCTRLLLAERLDWCLEQGKQYRPLHIRLLWALRTGRVAHVHAIRRARPAGPPAVMTARSRPPSEVGGLCLGVRRRVGPGC
jgi:hypothetical protein